MKTKIKKSMLMLITLCCVAFAQDKPKIAVYVSDHGYSQEEKSVLKTATQTALVKSGKYLVVERSSIVDDVQAEMARGDVDDGQMVAFGRQAGAKYVCVSDLTRFGTTRRYWQEYNKGAKTYEQMYSSRSEDYGDYQVSARIIDVETAELLAFGVINATNITSGMDLANTVKNTVEEMLNTVSSTETATNMPKMAVYIQGRNAENRIGNALYTFVQKALFAKSKSAGGDFKVVERSEAISKELGKQTSGSVDDGQIARMGKQYGIGRILVANVEYAKNTYNISARIIDVESGSILNASDIHHFYENPPSKEQYYKENPPPKPKPLFSLSSGTSYERTIAIGTISTLSNLKSTSIGIVKEATNKRQLQTGSAQDRPKIAVYVSDHYGYSQEEKSALKTATQTMLVRSGKYSVVERSSVVDDVQKELASGVVDDDQLVAFGKQAGAKYVCVSDMTQFGTTKKVWAECQTDTQGKETCYPKREEYSDYLVSARIIDVETAELVALGVVNTTNIKSGADLTGAVSEAVEEMLKTVSTTEIAPNMPKMAVYIQGGNARNSIGSAIYTFVQDALFARSKTNGDFKVVERSEAISKELNKQTSGSVDDGQIMRMGKQLGVERILVANVEYAMNNYNISARIIDVESGGIIDASEMRHFSNSRQNQNQHFGFVASTVSTLLDLRLVSIGVVEDMIKRKVTQAEIKAEQKRVEADQAADERFEEEREEVLASWNQVFFFGGGALVNMNNVDKLYSSMGGIFSVGAEIFKGNFDFFRIGANLAIGATGLERTEIRKIHPSADSIEPKILYKGNVFAKIHLGDVLYLSGGAGFLNNGYYFTDTNTNKTVETRSMILDYPVGIGLVGWNLAYIECLYHIVPDRSTSYFTITAGFRHDMNRKKAQLLEGKRRYERRQMENEKRMEELKRRGY